MARTLWPPRAAWRVPAADAVRLVRALGRARAVDLTDADRAQADRLAAGHRTWLAQRRTDT